MEDWGYNRERSNMPTRGDHICLALLLIGFLVGLLGLIAATWYGIMWLLTTFLTPTQ